MDMLSDYLEFTHRSESPDAYHKWTCLSMISGIIGKKCWLNFNYFSIYPNMYLVLVSLPGVGKKSTSMRIGKKMVTDSGSEICITQDALTPQALMIEMEDAFRTIETPNKKLYSSSSLTLFSSELVTLLGAGAGMVEFLTDIYDSDKSFEYKTKNAGKLTIDNPCLNVIGCATTETFSNKILQDAVAGGFISRAVVVYANDAKVISPFEMPSKSALTARARVVSRYAQIGELYGEILFSTAAKDHFETWYTKTFSEMAKNKTGMEFDSRLHVHVARTAMLLALSDISTIIELKHLEYAIEMLNEVAHYMKLVRMSAGASKYSESQLKILSAINTFGSVAEEDILTLFMGDTTIEEFGEQMELMMRVGYIKLEVDNHKRYFVITPKGIELFESYGG